MRKKSRREFEVSFSYRSTSEDNNENNGNKSLIGVIEILNFLASIPDLINLLVAISLLVRW